ncbi:MAG: hypothetical protein D6826_05345, partial [Alphaproteobacteria bacterium]
ERLRAAIAAALGAARDGSAYAVLVDLLDDPSVAVRLFAVQALGDLGRTEAAGPLTEFALAIDRRIANLSEPELLADVYEASAEIGLETAALRVLTALDPVTATPALVQAARARPLARDSAAGLRLAQAIFERRRIALYGLGYTGAAEAFTVVRGDDGLGDPDPRLRAVAVRSLGVLGMAGAVDLAVARLRDPSAEVRWTAASVLGRLADRAAVAPLSAALGDPVAEVRRQAALGLGYLGDERARAALEAAAAGDADDAVRAAAAYALTLL